MPLESLKDRHMLVLGGSSGMGYATASFLARSGSVVTISARTPDKLEAARKRMIKETGAAESHVRAAAGDGREPADVEAACAKAADKNGEVDGVFVVAGGGGYVPVTENTLEWCMDQYKLNVFPLVNVIKSVVPRMKKKGGSIVALSSTAAVCSYPKLSAYGAAKAALEFYAKVAADELGQYKIRINCVRSGFTKSGGTDRLMEDDEYLRRFKIITALDEPYGQSEDFGPMVSMLLSPDTRWITGQVFAIDGGLTIRGYGGGIFPKGL